MSEEVEMLRRRLERERQVREQAEAIAETSTRQLFERQRELELLVAVARAVIETDDARDALGDVLRALCEQGGWDTTNVFLAANGGESLQLSEVWHTTDPARFGDFRLASEASNFTSGHGLPGRVLRDARPQVIADVIDNPRFLRQEAARDSAIRGAVAFPVILGGEVLAVVELYSTATITDEESLLRIVDSVGSLMGRLIQQLER